MNDDIGDNQNKYLLVVLGSNYVGRSALTLQLIRNEFVEDFDPRIEDSYEVKQTIDDQDCNLDILVTGMQLDEYSAMRDQYLRAGQGFLCIYSITSRSSFEEISVLREQILRVRGEKAEVPIVIVGNKCDLETQRQVTTTEGMAMANSFGCPFFETSAKSRINVEESFYELVREIRNFTEPKPNNSLQSPSKKRACSIL
jgi:GTPase KRas